MATDYGARNQHLFSGLAGEDLSGAQYYFVVQSTAPGYYVVGTTAGGLVAGVLQNAPSSGQECTIAGPGSISKLMSDGTAQYGEMVTCSTAGTGRGSTGQGSLWQVGQVMDGGVSLVDASASTVAMMVGVQVGLFAYRSTAN